MYRITKVISPTKILANAEAKNCKKSFTIVDMPYNTYNSNKQALLNIRNLLNYTKCQAIKIETDESKVNLIKY